TGIVAADPAAYSRALEFLYRHPTERARLGQNARAFARRHFAPETMAIQFDEIYRDMMRHPPRPRPGTAAGPGDAGADLFVRALGENAPQFAVSRDGPNEEAERLIASSSPLLAFGEGGILHYRNAYPQDPYLRFWAGLVLWHGGRPEEAGREFQAAVALGLD